MMSLLFLTLSLCLRCVTHRHFLLCVVCIPTTIHFNLRCPYVFFSVNRACFLLYFILTLNIREDVTVQCVGMELIFFFVNMKQISRKLAKLLFSLDFFYWYSTHRKVFGVFEIIKMITYLERKKKFVII